MRTAIVYVLVALIIHTGETSNSDDFRPTPIPLAEWHHDKRQGRAGTLHETFRTDSPSTVAAVPAHYWEDALRHSVYLTLVRDKIDQLIAKGEVISAETDNKHVSKEVDDHDLWEKIKTAPFDRIQGDEPSSTSDVTIMAKGRLLETNGGFRFTEDDKLKDKCNDESCLRGVKAMWSVKRVRQRDQEISPGRYHYELTFSVISQVPVKQRKPYENPIRTFTVKESTRPYVNTARAHELERFPPPQQPTPLLAPRPTRAIWFHKNIVPPQPKAKAQSYGALDRIFSSLFSDDDDSSYEPTPKYKPHPYGQNSKVGYVGAPSDHHQQVNPPQQFRPPQIKYARPPHGIPSNNHNYQQHQTPPQQHQQTSQQYQQQPLQYQHHPQQQDKQHQLQPHQYQHHPQHQDQHYELGPSSSYNSHSYYNVHDHRVEPYSTVKTTRPAVLPTPLPPLTPEVTNSVSLESFENITTLPDYSTQKNNNKFKSTQSKVSYFTDHVRPPIYNAPPGVFVTMDKKPFKPMPPLKLVHTKGQKPNKPIDFRPSPQLHETQPLEPDFFGDSAFRPINIHFSNNSFTDNIEPTRKPEQKHRKTTSHAKKPSKKHSNVKQHHLSTFAPDIITAQALPEENLGDIDWTKFLSTFAKTTPMVSQADSVIVTEATTTHVPISTLEAIDDKITTAPYTPYSETTPVSSPKPKRRTRPPPQFTKPEKVRKHKRITTTSTTTIQPTRGKVTEKSVRKNVSDLTVQASSAPTGLIKSNWEQKNRTLPSSTTSTTTSSTTTSTTTTTNAPTTSTITTTTTKPTTTTRSPTSTTTESKPTTTVPRNRVNRFRQSTLLIKGTSVKHDKWSVIGIPKNNTSTAASPSYSYRRKGSNFQGYSSTTPLNMDKDVEPISSSYGSNRLKENNFETSTNYDIYESNSVIPLEESDEETDENEEDGISNIGSDDGETSDQNEFIFQATTIASDRIDDATNYEEPLLTTLGINPSSPPVKTKCKKKKNNQDSHVQSDRELQFEAPASTTPLTTITEMTSTNDFLDEILKYNFDDDTVNNTKLKHDLDGQESLHRGSYQKMEDHLKDFLDILNEKQDKSETSLDDQYDNNDEDDNDGNEFEDLEDREDDKNTNDDDDTSYDIDENENISSRHTINSEPKRPFSFLDLLV